jgi:hypothetical protein
MASPKKRHRKTPVWPVIRPWFLTILGISLLGGLWYLLVNLGPGKPVESPEQIQAAQPPDGELQRKLDEVAGLEARFKSFEAAGVLSDEALAVLSEAVEKQRAIARSPRYGDYVQQQTLDRLEGELDTIRARRTVDQIEKLMRAGEEDQNAMRLAESAEAYRRALELQRFINTGSASTRYKNYVREAEIERALTSLQVFPLHMEKEAALEKARAAMEAKRWTEALAAYVAARDKLGEINRKFARTRYANLAEYDRIEGEIASLNASGVAREIDEFEKKGDDAVVLGDAVAAARFFGEALSRQQQINQHFSRSRFVSSARIEALDTKLQTARSQPIAVELARLDRSISEDLRNRRLVAAEQALPAALRLADRLASEYPKSEYVDGDLRIKLSYLGLKVAELRDLQREVFDRLLPLVGINDRLLYGTETHQGLYQAVMNTNPSRNPGRAMPVDSVNWNDAQEFCKRLTWIMGVRVRLPTEEEYRLALGEGGGEIRSSVGGQVGATDTGRANANGYRDLLGNLVEWLDAPAGDTRARLIGGSVLDTPEAIAQVPVEERPKTDRARHYGFRFVVELPIAR